MCTLRVFFRNVPQLTSGVSSVTVNFTTVANADLVSVDVQRVLNAVRGKLRADAGVPSVNRIDPQGIATMVLSGQQALTRLQDIAENVLRPQFSSLPGVDAAPTVAKRPQDTAPWKALVGTHAHLNADAADVGARRSDDKHHLHLRRFVLG
jgi:hypothetical protein